MASSQPLQPTNNFGGPLALKWGDPAPLSGHHHLRQWRLRGQEVEDSPCRARHRLQLKKVVEEEMTERSFNHNFNHRRAQ